MSIHAAHVRRRQPGALVVKIDGSQWARQGPLDVGDDVEIFSSHGSHGHARVLAVDEAPQLIRLRLATDRTDVPRRVRLTRPRGRR